MGFLVRPTSDGDQSTPFSPALYDEAQREFNQHAPLMMAVHTKGGERYVSKDFDPDADEILLVPQIHGG